MFYFGNFIFQVKGVAAQNIQTSDQRDLRNLILNKSHPLSRHKANSGKNKEKRLMNFDSDARVFVLSN